MRKSTVISVFGIFVVMSLFGTSRADAQILERFSIRGEGAGGSMVSNYQLNSLRYGLAVGGVVRIEVSIVDPLSFQLSVSNWVFPRSGAEAGWVTNWSGGFRFEPTVHHVGRFFIDANAGVALEASRPRFGFDIGLGFEFALARFLGIGPVVRYGHVLHASEDQSADAQFVTVGLSLALHPAPTSDGSASSTPSAAPGPADNDRDGVPDRRDVCPTEPQGAHPDSARLGCPMHDGDSDGVPDTEDFCPAEPAGARPDTTQHGCPARDADGDGVPDREDECVTVPSGAHPSPRRHGCPDADTDGDGVLDGGDECPSVPAGPIPDRNRPGCPITDRDHDTVPDAVDHCPDQAGAPSRDPARNGCPGLVRVNLETNTISILRPVFFGTGNDVILDNSFPVLSAVADAMQAADIARVRIEGHTDSRGNAARNLRLSERRAASIARWLTQHGIAVERLESVGRGSASPLELNTTALGRAANRRVEFHITAMGTSTPAGSTAPSATP